jgi:PAS domain S-box-containing protein
MDDNLMKILAIDDNQDNLITIKAIIQEAFPEAIVYTALNGLKGIEMATTKDPDVILLDVIMPEMDGYEVCQKLKADSLASVIPVVFVTAIKGDRLGRIRALEVGAEAFLAKPIDESELIAQVKAMVKIKRANIMKRDENLKLSLLVDQRTSQLQVSNTATLNLFEDLRQEIEIKNEIEAALSESEARLTRAELASKSGNWELNITTKKMTSSIGASKLYGLEGQEFNYELIKDIPLPEYRDLLNDALNNLIEKNEPYDLEFQIKQFGSDKIIDIHSIAFFDKEKNIIFGVIQDITDEKQAKEDLKDSEVKFRTFVDYTYDWEYWEGLNHQIIYTTPSCLRISGYNAQEFISDNSLLTRIVHPDDKELFRNHFEKLHSLEFQTETEEFIFRIINKNSNVVYIEHLCQPVYDKNGIYNGRRISNRDITEKKIAMDALHESEAKYRNLMDNSPEGITIYLDGKIAYINKEAMRLMKANDKSELLGKTIVDFIHPDNQALVLERMKMVAMAPLNAILPSVEEKYIRLDGTEVDVEIKAMPIIYEGKPAFQLSGHDITVRKAAENALEKSRIELKAIYDNAPVMMCVVGEDASIQFANQAFAYLTDSVRTDMIGGQIGDVISCINSKVDSRGCGFGKLCKKCALRNAIASTLETGIGNSNIEHQSTMVHNGELIEVSLLASTALIQNGVQKSLLLCLIDITERKNIEKSLQKSETFLRTFIENTPFEIWARDIDSVGILENKKLTDHYGSIIGYTPLNDPRFNSETLRLLERNNSRAFAGEIVTDEYEFEVFGKNRVYQQIVFPIKNNEKTIGIAGFNIDITDKKLAEDALRESKEQLKKFAAHLQNVREEERILLAREIHDELGQILVAVKIDMGLLRKNVVNNSDKVYSEQVLVKFNDLSKLIDTTIQTARKIMTDLRPEVLDMLGFVDAVKQHLNNFHERYNVDCIFESTIDEVNLGSQQAVALFRIIQEALNNIAKHAKASEVRITLTNKQDKLLLQVIDNGVGFDQNQSKRTDSYGMIGMKERVYLLEGELNITSEVNKGTLVEVVLPYEINKK